ncbi:MAG: carboxylesterase family protein [Hungatella sp.]|jgi:para-nitrobenzyl esterase|nr:carboxylesterase family protein [Hungatella sp.]
MSIVKVTGGMVEGVHEDGYISFKGIPYAAPPVGDRRWKLPEPPVPWEGVKLCNKLGPACCQADNQVVPGGDPDDRGVVAGTSEDCLYLNVWTPDISAKKLPVFVWIHGGAFCCGSGGGISATPDTFVSRGIVYVSFNYRVGILGFFAHPELSAENEAHVSGNYAHYDQLAAVRWVKENIAAFGGDPENITIGGSSAGAGSSQCLATSPLAKGLFQKAIVMSSWGTMYSSYPEDFILRDREDMEERGKEFMELNGCKNIAELRQRTYEQLAATPDASFRKKYHYGTVMGTSRDGYLNPKLPRIAAQEFRVNDISLMIGCANDEGDGHMLRLGMDVFKKNSEPVFGDKMEEYLKLWETLPSQDIADIANATHLKFSGEKAYAAVSSELGRKPVYVYDFCRKGLKKGKKQAYHGLSSKYFFNRQKSLPGYEADDENVAFFIQEYCCNFIKNGNPNGEELPRWDPYTSKARNVMYMDAESRQERDENVENPVMTFTREMIEEKMRAGLQNQTT